MYKISESKDTVENKWNNTQPVGYLVLLPARRRSMDTGSGRAAASPSPLLAVPNVTAHQSTASVPTSYYSMWYYNSQCPLKG